jgi:hypothetical protein
MAQVRTGIGPLRHFRIVQQGEGIADEVAPVVAALSCNQLSRSFLMLKTLEFEV